MQDYKTSELGMYGTNWSSLFIDAFASMGLAYDLKTVPESVVRARVARTGDPKLHSENTGKFYYPENENEADSPKPEDGAKNTLNQPLPPWGWGDQDIPQNHFNITQTLMRNESSKMG